MTSRLIREKLAALGFAYDDVVTGRDPVWGTWEGTVDPVGCTSIGGECRGIRVSGTTRSAMDREALAVAKSNSTLLRPCADPDCDFHEDYHRKED